MHTIHYLYLNTAPNILRTARAPPESGGTLKQEWRGDSSKPLWAAQVTTVQGGLEGLKPAAGNKEESRSCMQL